MKAARGGNVESKSSGKQGSKSRQEGGFIDDMLVATKVTDSCRRWKK